MTDNKTDEPTTESSPRRVEIVFDDIDRHGAGCECGLCDASGKSYGYGIFDVAERPVGEESEDPWWAQVDPLIRVYSASELSGMETAKRHCEENGWTVAGARPEGEPPDEERLQDFIVEVREVWIQPKKARARTKEEALRVVERGGGEVIEEGFEYSHDLPADNWNVSAAT